MAQQYYNLYYAILPVKLSNMNVLMFHFATSQFFIPIFAKISTKRSLDRFELTEPKYKTKDLIPYELCLIFCAIDFFFPERKYSASCRTRYYTQER